MKHVTKFAWLPVVALLALGRLAAQPQTRHLAGDDAASVAVGFSGYDWQTKASRGAVGPGPCVFGSGGVRVDDEGYLHLGIASNGGQWVCSEIISKREFGYGEYIFVIRVPDNLDANAVLGLFLWDPSAPEHLFREVDFELSRWGDPAKANGQLVVQPFTHPENLDRFELAPGLATISFTWTSGRLFFQATEDDKLVREHLFTEGIPSPGHSNVRLNTWLYRSAPPMNGKPVEVVIDSFRFSPGPKRR